MKKILIISHSFPPLNLISSRRAEAFAHYFPTYGFSTAVVTELREKEIIDGREDWKWHSPGTAVKKEEAGTYSVYLVPRLKTVKQRIINLLLSVPVLKVPVRMLLVGRGHPHGYYYYCYEGFKSFLWRHLEDNKYDCILASYKPDYPVRLAYEIKKRFGIPFIIDYRDHWDNRLINIQQEFTWKDNFINFFAKMTHTRWLKEALFFEIVNNPLKELLTSHTGFKNGYVIPNGFEKSIFDHDTTPVSDQFFYITYTGNIYPVNDFSFFYKAIGIFLASLDIDDAAKVKIRFFTSPEANLAEQKKNIPSENLEINGWIAKQDVVKRLKESSILLTLGFTNQPGTIPGKVFEYLASGRNILVIPSDKRDLDELIKKTQAGLATSDENEAAAFLVKKFREWLSGRVAYEGNTSEISIYSREEQVGKLAALIEKHLAEA